MKDNLIILVTGATSGIGKATAGLLASKGFTVYGTGRKASGETVDGVVMLPLDVTNDESARNCVEEIIRREGRIDVLVNNAGYGIAGSIENTSVDEMRQQLETNLFGVHRMTKLVLPYMREQKSGRIVNISSVAGFISIPFQAFYSVSKYGVEAYSRALRCEVAEFGIKVSMVQPGDTKTGFTGERKTVKDGMTGVYGEKLQQSVKRMAHDEQTGRDPIFIARAVLKTIKRKNPPVSLTVGIEYKAIKALSKVLPEKLVSFAIRKLYA